jgi:hypothetical protein
MIYGPNDKVAILECPQSGLANIVAKAWETLRLEKDFQGLWGRARSYVSIIVGVLAAEARTEKRAEAANHISLATSPQRRQ